MSAADPIDAGRLSLALNDLRLPAIKLIWPDFAGHWGNTGPAGTVEQFNTMGPFPIPTINTALLLTSGVTLTIAHHALRAGHRSKTAFWLFLTVQVLEARKWS